MRRSILFLASVLCAAPAFAQSTYVAGGVGVDVFRSDRVEGRGADGLTAGGEATAFSLRLGTAIRENWGVELEITRPSEIEREVQRGFPVPLLTTRMMPTALSIAAPIAIPLFESTITVERRNTTLDAVAWIAQAVSNRVDLVYLGGVAFTRVDTEIEFEVTRRANVIGAIFPVLPSTRTVSYSFGPVVGVEGRLDLTEHVMLVPGVRLHGIGGGNAAGGWLLRPSVGLGWTF